MKNTSIKIFLISLLLLAFSSHAGLYKGLDEEGNVVYSDTPFENAETLTPPAISVVDAPKVPPKKAVAKEDKDASTETTYTRFNIVSPKNDETIWNVPQLSVSLKLSPELDVVNGHTVWLLMDGKALVKNSRSLALQISQADRGAHKVQAQVRNKKGKIIKRTKSITVHIKNTVVTRPTPRSN